MGLLIVVVVFFVLLIFFSLLGRISREIRNFRQSAEVQERSAAFLRIDQSIAENDIRTLVAMPEHYFTPVVWNEYVDLELTDPRLRRYLLAFRIYHHLVPQLAVQTGTFDGEPLPRIDLIDVHAWLQESMRTEEFRQVHARWGDFYPGVCRQIDDVLFDTDLGSRSSFG